MLKKIALALIALTAISGLATFGRKIVLARFES